jgi:hypothetical protein
LTLRLDSRPAASYQHYQGYSHYQQQPAYQTYQQYAAPPPQQQNMARQAIANSQHANAGALDTADVATLNDALGSAGVDLRVRVLRLSRYS